VTLTVTDLFCGAGGASLGAETVTGVQLVMAANHWARAIEVHQVNFPQARHDCADISQVDFRRYPATDILIAGCECTNHSQAKGVSRKKQSANLFEGPDPGAERSRATMWDVPRYIEIHRPAAVIVENVVEASKWIFWDAWRQALDAAGYKVTVCSINSMHTGQVPQSRDRIYIVCVRKGIAVDLEFRPAAWCPSCEATVEARQAWKNGRTVGKYRSQYVWRCAACNTEVHPEARPAAVAIDWALPSQRIGDRARPLADATLRRIRIGLERYGVTVAAVAGNTWEAPGSGYARVWPTTEPLPTQACTAQHALACPPLIAELRGGGSTARPVDQPLCTVEAGGNHHALVCPPQIIRPYTPRGSPGQMSTSVDDPMPTQTGAGNCALMVPPLLVETAHAGADDTRVRSVEEPFRTITASDDRPLVTDAYYVKNYGTREHGDGQMVYPTATTPFGTVTSADHHSLLVPYYGHGQARPTDDPMATVTTRDRQALVAAHVDLDDCTLRMLEPHEVGAAMAFPATYKVTGTKKDRVRMYGNACTPPTIAWIVGRIAQALAA
jgi:DNA (cytosine-5)-methyltransferase 1